ncbi:MAG: glycosyltransferase family 4 protein [Candidatus Aminicenantales bacterium]
MKPRVAVVHQQLLPGGGSEVCAMWTLQALADEYQATLITMGRPDIAALNRSCGTAVDEGRIEVRALPIPPGLRRRFDALRGVRLDRYCRRHAGEFDVMVSAYNVMDFGLPGVQIVADFSFDDDLRREVHAGSGAADGALYAASAGRSFYMALAKALSGRSEEGWAKNRTLAVSEWVRGLLKDRFDVDSTVLYPPVSVVPPRISWEDREDGFVVMGRLVPEKGLPLVVDILSEVRKVKPVHLHILGRPARAAYAREIERLCGSNPGWVHLEGEIYGPEKDAFLARHKYGISGCRGEALGVGLAEMIVSGAIVWVPDGGGQTEVVTDAALIYAGRDDAVSRIVNVITDAGRETALRRHLEERAAVFSSSRFVSGLRAVVRDFLTEGQGRGA